MIRWWQLWASCRQPAVAKLQRCFGTSRDPDHRTITHERPLEPSPACQRRGTACCATHSAPCEPHRTAHRCGRKRLAASLVDAVARVAAAEHSDVRALRAAHARRPSPVDAVAWAAVAKHSELRGSRSAGDTCVTPLTRRRCRPGRRSGKFRRARCAPCLLYTSPSPRDRTRSRMPSSA